MPLAMTVHLGNKPMSIIHGREMVTLKYINCFQIFHSSTMIPKSLWLLVYELVSVQTKLFDMMGHLGNTIHFPSGFCIGPHTISPLQDISPGLTSSGTPYVSSPQLEYNEVICLMFPSTTPPGYPTGALKIPPLSPPTNWFQSVSTTTASPYCRVHQPAPISESFQWQIWYRWWIYKLVQLGQCRRQSPSKPKAHWILFGAMCHKDRSATYKHLSQIEGSIGDRVSGKIASGHYLGTELLELPNSWPL